MDNKHEFTYEGQVNLLSETPQRTADTFKSNRETENKTDFTVSDAMNRLGSRELANRTLTPGHQDGYNSSLLTDHAVSHHFDDN